MIYRQKSLDADGQTDRHADTQTDRVAHRVALQLMLAARLKTHLAKVNTLGLKTILK